MISEIKLKSGKTWPVNAAFHGDNLEFMNMMDDKAVDLVLTDPPYGIFDKKMTGSIGISKSRASQSDAIRWDQRPSKEYFDEMFRISKEQIIWGAQYFTEDLPDFKSPIVWDKGTGDNYFADGELAFCSYPGTLRIIRHKWVGYCKDSERGEDRIHPTQKPKYIMKWCLEKYVKDKDIIVFDPFLGSFTTAIACYQYGISWIGCEKDDSIYRDGLSRYELETKQKYLDF